ncbi:MAG: DUF3631 domain-containing protein, partial [Planctomycetota bacterium]
TWYCQVCAQGGGALELAKLLGVPLPERDPIHRYAVREADGTLKATKCRTGRGSAKKCWWEPKGVKPRELPLFGLVELTKAPPDKWAILTEGEQKAEALQKIGVVAAGTVTGASVIPKDHRLAPLVGRNVALWWDNDGEGRKHMQAIAARLLELGAKDLHYIDWPDAPEKGDAYDWIAAGGKRADLEGMLKPYAVPVHAVEEAREAKQGAEPEPWPDPVMGSNLLDDLAAYYRRYIVLPDHAATFLALYTLHTYSIDAAYCTPYVVVHSPVKKCGKTRLLQRMADACYRPTPAAQFSPAALFRTIEEACPTVLLDEQDASMGKKGGERGEELRCLMNAGFERGPFSLVYRCEGRDHKPRKYSVFCAKVFALIGDLPTTLMDRGVVLNMQRRKAGEKVARAKGRKAKPVDLCRKALRWAQDHVEALRDAEPKWPEGTYDDRLGDKWEALWAIADRVGNGWPERARVAALALADDEPDEDELKTILLADIRDVFGARETMTTKAMLSALCDLDERPWATWGKEDKGLNANSLAWLLRPFGIRSDTIRYGDTKAKGYRARAFQGAFESYLSPLSPAPGRGTVANATTTGDSGDSEPWQEGPNATTQNGPEGDTCGICHGATAQDREDREKDAPDPLLDDDGWWSPPAEAGDGRPGR